MRLDDERESENVEDRRGRGGGFGFPGGGRTRRINIPMGRRSGGLGIGGIIILLIAAFVFGINPMDMIGGGGGLTPQTYEQTGTQQVPRTPKSASQDQLAVFAGKVLKTTERTWDRIFKEQFGRSYQRPVLVLYTGRTPTGCGQGQAVMGPFYCPADNKLYIDLSFFQDMQRKLGASGDFAHAYVIAHEVGHHVQNQLGIAGKVTAARMRASKVRANELSVRMELQADCFSGVWAHDNRDVLDRGDIEEGLNAASAIGDDRLQRRSRGVVVPESFTHGSSAQRVRWFKRGIESGDVKACDTFAARRL